MSWLSRFWALARPARSAISRAWALLREQGYDCVGATMELYGTPAETLEDARAAAERMGIPHHVLPLCREVEERRSAISRAWALVSPPRGNRVRPSSSLGMG